MDLLSRSNTKTVKGEKLGFLTYILHLAPNTLSGYQVCPRASPGCINCCINLTGLGVFSTVQKARLRKTKLFFEDRKFFLSLLVRDIQAAQKLALREKKILCLRLNGTSDIKWEKVPVRIDGQSYQSIVHAFPAIQFYDYTKHVGRFVPENYVLTFSLSEINQADAKLALYNGLNVAVVFRDRMPKTYWGLPVFNGELNDLRFLDPRPRHIIGLRAKGRAQRDSTGFVKDEIL